MNSVIASTQLSRKASDGSSNRDHTIAAAKAGNEDAKNRLESERVDPVLNHILRDFWNLRHTCDRGMSGAAITYPDIESWCRVTGRRPRRRIIKLILEMDRAARFTANEERKTGKNA